MNPPQPSSLALRSSIEKSSLSLDLFRGDPNHIPVLERNVDELNEAAKRLISRPRVFPSAPTSQQQQQQLVERPTMLIDVDRLERDLQPLETIHTIHPQMPKTEEYNLHEKIIVDVIALSLDRLKEETDATLLKDLDQDWEL